ncbi:MAG: TonB family protein [Proteobacteria bacterium]|nr:TonB family protein [Pseudomonadota bacterium]NDG27894.1 TonB family protein [Pseudomonadota bacterium]
METFKDEFIGIPRKALVLSLGLHVAAALTVLALSAIKAGSLSSLFSSKKLSENMYQSFVQVDVVGLPDELANQKLNPLLPEVSNPSQQTEETKNTSKTDTDIREEAKASKKPAQKNGESEKKREQDRKKEQEAALKSALEEAKREQALKSLQNKSGQSGRGKIKGNILSQGTSSTGAIGNAKDKYIGVLTESIKQQFNVFSWQQKNGLVAEVKLMLLPNGRVKWRKIVKPSRDLLYDSAVLQAIDDAQPFPVPEDKNLLNDEITINFKP